MEHSATLELVQKEVARIVGVDSVEPDIGLSELGVDSLNVVELILVFEQLYGKPVEPDQLVIDQYTTLRDLDQQLLRMGEPADVGTTAAA
jgi:acyl carrier protein